MADIPPIVWFFAFIALIAVGSFVMVQASEAITHRRNRQLDREKAAIPPEPVCGCKHHIAFHDDGTGECGVQVKMATEWGRNPRYDDDEYYDEPEEIATKWELRQCPCKRYFGPEPITALYMPELSPAALKGAPRPKGQGGVEPPPDWTREA